MEETVLSYMLKYTLLKEKKWEKKCLSKTWALQVQFRFWMLQDILNLWVRVFACRAVAWAVPSLFPIPPCAQDGSQVAAVAGQSPHSLPSREGWRFSVLISQVICKSQISPSRSKTPSFGRGMVPKLSKNRANPRSAVALSESSIPLEATRSSLRRWKSCRLR